MGTKDFNLIDKIIAYFRLNKISKYIKSDSVILDFGCGNQAYFLKNVKNKIKNGIGIDYDVRSEVIPTNIKLMKFKFKDKLPFPKNYFTEIFLLAVLEHLELDKVNILFNEFKRVLKNKGRIILTTPTPLSKPLLEFLAFKLHLISKKEIGDHKKYYGKKDIVKIAKKSNLVLKSYSKFQLGLNSYSVLIK